MNQQGPYKCPKCGEHRASRVIGRPPAILVKYRPGDARIGRGRG